MPLDFGTRKLTPPGKRWGRIRRAAEEMLRFLRIEDAELSLMLCDDTTIADLNQRFRDESKATDVLAFPSLPRTSPEQPWLLGDIVISVEHASLQADKRGVSLEEEIIFLLAHGLLHLLGFDHRDRAEERRMKARNDLLCRVALIERKRPRRDLRSS